MAGFSSKCGDCGTLLKSVEEAQEHAELTKHANFVESTEAVLNLVCSDRGKPCCSKTESDLHTKRTGHTNFADKTSETAKPISLEVPKPKDDVVQENGETFPFPLPNAPSILVTDLHEWKNWQLNAPIHKLIVKNHIFKHGEEDEYTIGHGGEGVHMEVEDEEMEDSTRGEHVSRVEYVASGRFNERFEALETRMTNMEKGFKSCDAQVTMMRQEVTSMRVTQLEEAKRSERMEKQATSMMELLESFREYQIGQGVTWPRPVMEEAGEGSSTQQEEMVVPEVNQQILSELAEMGFSKERATRALHFSGNESLEAAAYWIVEHENDPDIDQMPLVPVGSKNPEVPKKALTPEEIKQKQQELRERARKKKEEEEKLMEREREKERIQIGKELLEAKRIEEDNERKRIMALRKAEKEEEKRAREKIRQKLEEDKAERRRKLGLPPDEPAAANPSAPPVEEKKSSLPIQPATKAERMRECLRTLKQSPKEDEAKVKTALNTLLTFAKNVATNPNEEKFRKIRLTNANFQDRVGKLKGGIEFLELCGFEKIEGGEFLYLPREKVDIAVLHTAGSELTSAINNPFFGVL